MREIETAGDKGSEESNRRGVRVGALGRKDVESIGSGREGRGGERRKQSTTGDSKGEEDSRRGGGRDLAEKRGKKKRAEVCRKGVKRHWKKTGEGGKGSKIDGKEKQGIKG